MSNNFSTHSEMLDAFAAMQKKFDNASYQMQMTTISDSFVQENAQAIEQAKNGLRSFGEDNPLVQNSISVIEALDASNKKIIENARGMISGEKFRKRFQDSLVILVYGKVKSGKSSLGNYLAWGSPAPTDEIKAKAKYKPVFETIEQNDVAKGGDAEKQAERDQAFKVGVTETTSSIQTFSVPGLTWVDVPGVHSIRQDNENLAQEYVKHADLVLYTLSSENPGRSSDIEELGKVIGEGKEPILIITKFDTNEEDVDDDGNIIQILHVKDDKTKELQINAVKKALLDHNIDASHMRVIPVSAMYAYKHNDDMSKLKESGVTELFDVLKVIAENEAFKLKMMEPIKSSQATLKSIEKEFRQHQESIKGLHDSLNRQLNQFSNRLNLQKSRLGNMLINTIDDNFNNITQYSNDAMRNPSGDAQRHVQELLTQAKINIENRISQLVVTAFEEQLADFSVSVNHKIDNNWVTNSSSLNLNYNIDTEEIRVATGVKRSGGRSGLLGALIGGTAGFLVGGPFGAAAGAVGGGALSRSSGSSHITYSTSTVVKGDNLLALRDNCRTFYKQALEQYLDKTITSLVKDVNVQAEQSVALIEQTINKTLNQIEVLEDKLNQQADQLMRGSTL